MIRALAAALAIVGATVHTGDGPPLEGATVVVDGRRVVEVGRQVSIPPGARVIDGRGRVVTAGLVDAASRLGLVDVLLEGSSVEGTLAEPDPVRAALRVTDGFNPAALPIAIARAGGLTSALVIPTGGIVSGRSAWVDLLEREPVRRAGAALHVSLGAGAEPGSRAHAFLVLRRALEDARLYRANRGPYIARRLRELSVSAADLEVLADVLARELPVVFEVDRAADIHTALQIAREYQLRAVVLGAAEGWQLADELARARVPVLVDPLQNLPEGFDSLQARLDNAVLLHAAGVRVAFTLRGASHLAHRLRFAAGNAVAAGFPREAALAAITRVPAEIFEMKDKGVLRPGASADLVVWNGDPFEVTTWPVEVLIRGERVDLRTRQDLLTERYSGVRPAW